jgi:hypothetical protein
MSRGRGWLKFQELLRFSDEAPEKVGLGVLLHISA